MLTEYLSYYLIFVIAASILIALIVLRVKFFAPRYLLPIIAVVILFPAMIVYLYFTYFTSIPEVLVPDLTGMRQEEAFVKLESLKLKGREAGKVFDMMYDEGRVVSQRPEGGRKVKVGRSVSLLTSSGKRSVLVPNLLGRLAVQARAVLSANGLILGMASEEYVPELDPGIILAQSPLPGEEIDAGSYISITVSTSFEPEVVVEEGPSEVEKKEEAPRQSSGQGGFWPW
ncbi:MAG: PASTA domain-containing protein [Candidatus Margulisiibacteriota bacterium]